MGQHASEGISINTVQSLSQTESLIEQVSLSYDKATERGYEYVYLPRIVVWRILVVLARVMARDLTRWPEGIQSLIKFYTRKDIDNEVSAG
jgi:hypothetical protein